MTVNECKLVTVKICGARTQAGTACKRNPGKFARCPPHSNRQPQSRRPPATKKKRVNYRKYLGSAEWKQKRIDWMANNDPNCYGCGKKWRKGFNLHHVTYERLGKERDSDLVMVCVPCHDAIHDLYRFVKPLRAATDAVRASKGLPVPLSFVKLRRGVKRK